MDKKRNVQAFNNTSPDMFNEDPEDMTESLQEIKIRQRLNNMLTGAFPQRNQAAQRKWKKVKMMKMNTNSGSEDDQMKNSSGNKDNADNI